VGIGDVLIDNASGANTSRLNPNIPQSSCPIDALSRLHGAVAEFVAAAAVVATRWTVPRAPGKWSPSQVVEHVARIMEESANVSQVIPPSSPRSPSAPSHRSADVLPAHSPPEFLPQTEDRQSLRSRDRVTDTRPGRSSRGAVPWLDSIRRVGAGVERKGGAEYHLRRRVSRRLRASRSCTCGTISRSSASLHDALLRPRNTETQRTWRVQ
jgi:hypothetical protein